MMALTYEIEETDHGRPFYYLWTPKQGEGVILGCGSTEQSAKADAVRTLEATIDRLTGAPSLKPIGD